MVARRAHNPKVVGSNPAPATNDGAHLETLLVRVCSSGAIWEPTRDCPKAATLWGDRNDPGPSGFLLLKPVDAFKSPPHVHNVSYRGVVIRRLMHNDDSNADEMWMPTGSFWTQPNGGVHITAAKWSNTLAYIETEEGPDLVLAVEKAFDSEDKPVNGTRIEHRLGGPIERVSDRSSTAKFGSQHEPDGLRELIRSLRLGRR